LEKLNSLLKPNSRILDLGCGAGKPIDEFFINHGHKIVGIDISSEQVKLAKKNIPAGSFKIKDIASLKEKEFEVEAVVSFYTIFHLPRKKHQKLFKIINSFLRAGGLLLITMGTSDWEGTGDFYKTQMYWSHYGPEKNRKIIEEAGFEIIFDKIDTSGGEKHQITLARKITTPT
jgi:cyclopropane fatty-acyl-phospholipid synthase-like methyltransferase